MLDGGDETAARLAVLAAVVVTVGTVPAVGSTTDSAPEDARVGETLRKALEGQAPYDEEPYVTDGTARVMLAGPDPGEPPAGPDTREGWVEHFEAHHEPFKAYATDLVEDHGAEVTRTVASANTVFARIALDDVPDLLEDDRKRRVMIETAALDWEGAVQLANTESVPPTEVASFHDAGFTGDGILLAGLDTGIDDDHPCMRDADGDSRVVKWKDFVNGEAEPYDDHEHGTHTATTAAGSPASTGCEEPGMAPKADVMGVKIFNQYGGGSWEDAQAGLDWAFENGADVATNSWGGACDAGGKETRDQVNELGEAGFDQAFAAGNSGPDASSLLCPGTARYAVTVGATDKGKNIEAFSSRGPCDDGTGERVCPDLVAVGRDVRSAVPGGGYEQSSGTSMATPHVGGAVAVVEHAAVELLGRDLVGPEEHPSWAPIYSEAEHLLKDCAEDLGQPGPDNDHGWGFIQLDCAHETLLERARANVTAEASAGDPLLECEDADRATLTLENTGGQPATGTAVLAVEGAPERRVTTEVHLDPGETATVETPVDAELAPGDHAIRASYAYTWEDPATGETLAGNASAEATVHVRKAVLEPARSGPGPVAAGTTAVTELALANTGNAPAHAVHVREIVPTAFDVVPQLADGPEVYRWSDPPADSKQTRTNGTTYLDYEVGTLPAGAAWTVSYELLAEVPGEHPLTSDVAFSDHGACEASLDHETAERVTLEVPPGGG